MTRCKLPLCVADSGAHRHARAHPVRSPPRPPRRAAVRDWRCGESASVRDDRRWAHASVRRLRLHDPRSLRLLLGLRVRPGDRHDPARGERRRLPERRRGADGARHRPGRGRRGRADGVASHRSSDALLLPRELDGPAHEVRGAALARGLARGHEEVPRARREDGHRPRREGRGPLRRRRARARLPDVGRVVPGADDGRHARPRRRGLRALVRPRRAPSPRTSSRPTAGASTTRRSTRHADRSRARAGAAISRGCDDERSTQRQPTLATAETFSRFTL